MSGAVVIDYVSVIRCRPCGTDCDIRHHGGARRHPRYGAASWTCPYQQVDAVATGAHGTEMTLQKALKLPRAACQCMSILLQHELIDMALKLEGGHAAARPTHAAGGSYHARSGR